MLTLFFSSFLLKSLKTIQRLDLIILTFYSCYVLMHSNMLLQEDTVHCSLNGVLEMSTAQHMFPVVTELIEKCKENCIDLLIMQQSPSK